MVGELKPKSKPRRRKPTTPPHPAGSGKLTVGRKIELLLFRSGMSHTELAGRIGVHAPRISKWIHADPGQRVWPSPSILLKISDAFNVSLRYLCDESITDPDQIPVEPKIDGEGPISDTERFLLSVCRRLGYEVAEARLFGRPETDVVAGGQPLARPSGAIPIGGVSKRRPKKSDAPK